MTFVPHLLPLDQGELVSAYVTPTEPIDQDELDALYADAYQGEPFVEITQAAARACATCARPTAAGSWSAPTRAPGKVLVFSAIDNLWKGAASQAVQNLNLMLGRPEAEGLDR